MVGVDLGVARFATLSDGSFLDPLHALKRREQRLRRYQRMMSRKKKFSNNWKKAKGKVQKQHQKVADSRADFDQGWSEFAANWSTSRLGAAGTSSPHLRQTPAEPACPVGMWRSRTARRKLALSGVECGFSEHADLVGAINVLAAGHAVIACGEMVQSDHPTKQEPAETAA